jgi:hypothetical protein
MTIWTQFLPGVRETRNPLAVGSIWVVVAALLFQYLPRELRNGELALAVRHAVAAVPTTVVVGVGLFGAYLLGIILSEAAKIIVLLVAGVWNIAPVAVTIYVLGILVLGYFWQLVAFAAVVAFVAWLIWRRIDDVPYLEYLSQVLSRAYLSAARFYSDSWNDLKTAWDPSRYQVDYMVREESTRALATSTALRAKLVAQLPVRLLVEVVRAVKLQESEFQRALVSVAAELKPLTLATALRQAKLSPEAGAVLRAAVEEKVAANSTARQAFLARAINTNLIRLDLRNRADRAHVQLRAQYEGVYNEYDRLRAEGDFRTAIAVPLCRCGLLRR